MISWFRQTAVLSSLCLMLLTGVAGCATNIARDELLGQMRAGASILIVDVRSRGEYDRDHIPGAVHIPFTSVGSGLRARGHSQSEPLVLYCEHGPRSAIAGFSLYLSGYDKVYSLEGDMKAWRKEEFPIEVITP